MAAWPGWQQHWRRARSGARVILAELQNSLGGSAHRLHGSIDGMPASDWVQQAEAELARMPEVKIIKRGVVFGYHDHNFLTIRESLTDHLELQARQGFRERLWRVRAKQVVLATGAHERPMVFGNNDLPGIMLSSALADLRAALRRAGGAAHCLAHQQRQRLWRRPHAASRRSQRHRGGCAPRQRG